MKEFIKNLVRESLGGLISEKEKTPEKEGEENPANVFIDETITNKDQAEIQSVFEKPLAPSMADAWKAAGLGDANNDAGIRSMARKKIKQEDGQGLTDVEKDALSKTLKDKM